MFPRVSVSKLLSDLAADGTAITFDLPDNGYDKLHEFIEQKGILPASVPGRLTVAALTLLASRIVQQQLGRLGPVANYLNELSEDGIREEAKRILERARATAPPQSATGSDALCDLTPDERTRLLTLYAALDDDGKRRLRMRLVKLTAARLGKLANLPPDLLRIALELTEPPERPSVHGSSAVARTVGAVNGFLFPWLR